MPVRWFLASGLCLLSVFMHAASAGAQSPFRVVAPAPPPPARAEMLPPPPAVDTQIMTWQPGHWAWNGAGWVWLGGTYVPRAHPTADWEPGHWAPRPGAGYIWVPGRWRAG